MNNHDICVRSEVYIMYKFYVLNRDELKDTLVCHSSWYDIFHTFKQNLEELSTCHSQCIFCICISYIFKQVTPSSAKFPITCHGQNPIFLSPRVLLFFVEGVMDFSDWDMGVSKNNGTPKWMVYNGKSY